MYPGAVARGYGTGTYECMISTTQKSFKRRAGPANLRSPLRAGLLLPPFAPLRAVHVLLLCSRWPLPSAVGLLLCSRRPIPSAPGCCCAPAVRCPSRSLSPAPASKLVVLPSPAPLSSATSSLPRFCLFSQPLRTRPRRPSAATARPTPTVPSSASASASPASSPASRAPSARRAAAAAGFLLPIHTHARARMVLFLLPSLSVLF